MSLLQLFLPRGDIIEYSRYSLGGVLLPRPVYMKREPIYTKKDMVGIDGKQSRDIVAVKEIFTLKYVNIPKKIYNRIYALLLGDSYFPFIISEENLTLSSTNVLATIVDVDYQKGGSQFVSFTLELVEVS